MRRLLVVWIAVGMVAAACSSTAATTLADEPSGGTDEAPPLVADPPFTDEQFPFDAVLLELFGTTDVPAYLDAVERRSDELIAVCMREAGFEFELPVAAPAGPPESVTSTLEYAQNEGFGLVMGFRGAIESATRSTGDIDETNRSYLESLTAAELAAFFETLNGPPAEPGQLQTEPGCSGQANLAAYAEWDRFLGALPQYTALGEERDTHPDWLDARDRWQACMIDRGFDYDDPDAIRTDVATRMESLMVGDGDRVVIQTVDGVTLSPQIEALFAEALDFERGAAIANFECNEPLQPIFDAVEHDVQRAFVDRNAAVINDLLAANA